MSQTAFGTGNMAVTTDTRSNTNFGPTTSSDNKGNGKPLASNFGATRSGWGSSSNIWGNGGFSNGFNSRDATRDNSRSRDTRPSSSDEEIIEGKTGSGSLVDSSVLDDSSWKSTWGTKRSMPSARSMSNAHFSSDTPVFQPRSVSNAGLPTSFANANQSSAPFASRPPTISLNATSSTQPRPGMKSPYSPGYLGHASEQPPAIYTKFNRADQPNARKPDSAKEGLWSEYSPTDERKPSFSGPFGSRTGSTPVSRDGSIQSSHPGEDHQLFMRSDLSRIPQRPAHGSSRAPSLSSQANGVQTNWTAAHFAQLEKQLEQVHLNGSHRPRTANKSSIGSAATFNQPSPFSTTSPYAQPAASGAGLNDSEDFEDFGRSYADAGTFVPATYSELAQNGFTGRNLATSTASELAQQPFPNNLSPAQLMDLQAGFRPNPNWAALQDGAATANRRLPNMPEQSPYLDFRMPQRLPISQYGNTYLQAYNPYTGLPFNPASSFMPFLPMTASPIDAGADARDVATRSGESMQSLLMYEFKTNSKSRRYELKDIYDHVAEFSGDQHGSRFIQTKLETANSDEKQRVFDEIEPNAIQLMTDVFGNYVIQKFFEHGDQKHKKILANKMKGEVLILSLQMYGCRVVQKALDHVLVDQQYELVSELEGQVIKCVKDQNGNHVIQKAIERCRPEAIRFIIRAFIGEVQTLSVHPYGCRVIQRCIERCEPEAKEAIMAELMQCMEGLISDQYGNYVVQHVVMHDDGAGKRMVLDMVERRLEAYSKHKFASNVVEKCLEHSSDQFRWNVVRILASGNPQRAEGEGVFVSMIKDSYGNYVIQKLLETLEADQYCQFVNMLQPNLQVAKRTGCGKQVQSIERKMSKFTSYRGGPTNGSTYNTPVQRIPPPPAYSNAGSAMTTPLLTPGTQSLQSSALASLNGDAVEGAAIGSRRGSEQPPDGFFH